MIFELTADDWWSEFVFWRSHGQKKIAFDYIRVYQDTEYFEMLVSLIAKRKYRSGVLPGDIIRLGDIEVRWTQGMEDGIRSSTLPGAMRNLFQGNERLRY
jgi:hypothetical protein